MIFIIEQKKKSDTYIRCILVLDIVSKKNVLVTKLLKYILLISIKGSNAFILFFYLKIV